MPGRPRKPPEVVSQARREASWKRHHPGQEPPKPAKQDDGKLPLPGHCSYDDVVCRPITYQDAVQREKAIAEEIENEKRREDALIRRGKLFTEERFHAYNELVMSKLAGLAELAASLVEPAAKAEARSKAREWLQAIRVEVAEALAKERRR